MAAHRKPGSSQTIRVEPFQSRSRTQTFHHLARTQRFGRKPVSHTAGLGVAPVSIHYGTTGTPQRAGHPRERDGSRCVIRNSRQSHSAPGPHCTRRLSITANRALTHREDCRLPGLSVRKGGRSVESLTRTTRRTNSSDPFPGSLSGDRCDVERRHIGENKPHPACRSTNWSPSDQAVQGQTLVEGCE